MPEQKLITLKINEREVRVPQGTLLIEATRRIGTVSKSACVWSGVRSALNRSVAVAPGATELALHGGQGRAPRLDPTGRP